MDESDWIEVLEEPVEIKAVENFARIFGADLRFAAHFIGRDRDFRRTIPGRFYCGKVVNRLWTRRQNFGYFSLAPGVSFRQNPAAPLILSRLRISILRDETREGVRSGRLESDRPDNLSSSRGEKRFPQHFHISGNCGRDLFFL
jgi:hypothetical protein